MSAPVCILKSGSCGIIDFCTRCVTISNNWNSNFLHPQEINLQALFASDQLNCHLTSQICNVEFNITFTGTMRLFLFSFHKLCSSVTCIRLSTVKVQSAVQNHLFAFCSNQNQSLNFATLLPPPPQKNKSKILGCLYSLNIQTSKWHKTGHVTTPQVQRVLSSKLVNPDTCWPFDQITPPGMKSQWHSMEQNRRTEYQEYHMKYRKAQYLQQLHEGPVLVLCIIRRLFCFYLKPKLFWLSGLGWFFFVCLWTHLPIGD